MNNIRNLSTKEFVDFSVYTHKQIDVNKFVYAALTNGLGYAQTIRLLSEYSMSQVSSTDFYNRIDQIFSDILNLTKCWKNSFFAWFNL